MSVCNRMFVFLKKNKKKTKVQLIRGRTGWVAAASSFYPRPLRNNLSFCFQHRPPAIPYSKSKRVKSLWRKECWFPTAFFLLINGLFSEKHKTWLDGTKTYYWVEDRHGSKNSLNWGLDKLIVHYWRFWCEWITGFGPRRTNDATDLYFHHKCIFWHVFWLLVY